MYSPTGAEQTFVVPAGVSSVGVVGVGGEGGAGAANGGAGGFGATVTGDVAVTPGEVLYVEVGADGQSAPNEDTGGLGGFNGGGSGSTYGGSTASGGGGGASDVRTCSMTSLVCPLGTPLIRACWLRVGAAVAVPGRPVPEARAAAPERRPPRALMARLPQVAVGWEAALAR
jgi:hypothetical protein